MVPAAERTKVRRPGAAADGATTCTSVDAVLAPRAAPPDTSLERNFSTASSCGLCGKGRPRPRAHHRRLERGR
ncbi:hypothetical protein GCM10018771_71990 [Streptomyces cellulosae]|nr:hypothetical protein GCM10018771_71990 [Streptomyces cellulosae]